MFSFLGDFIEGGNLVPPLSAVQMDCKYLKLFGVFFPPNSFCRDRNITVSFVIYSGGEFFVFKSSYGSRQT